MKAICVLFCLSLAHYTVGSIFHRRSHPRYSVESKESIEQYQQQFNQQRQEQLKNVEELQRLYRNQFSQQDLLRQQIEGLNINRFSDSASKEASKESFSKEHPSKEYQTRESHSKESHSKESRSKEHRSKESASQENILQQLNLPYGDVYAVPMFADMNSPPSNLALMRSAQNQGALFGDAITWKGVQLAVNPLQPITKDDIEKIYSEAQKTMQHVDPETKANFHKILEEKVDENQENYNNATELLNKKQYPFEKHSIKTDDGYVLTLFRIQQKQQQSREVQQKPVVFLMHDLLGSADDWLLMDKSLAYQLADAGFDVWLGSARGSKYSKHVTKHRAQPDFWQFSNDEIALYDLPAMIDYVLQKSEQQKMFYVGHGLGTTTFFTLAAARPEYNNKIAMMYALSPMVYMSHVRSPMFRMIAPTSQLHETLNEQLGNAEFKPSKEVVHTIGGSMCQNEINCKHLCSNVYVVMSGINVKNMNASQIAAILRHLPAGGSTKQMKQYGQAVASHEFKMFDYGTEVNKKVYGKKNPPQYQMNKVTAPVALYYSEEDWLAHPKDVQRLENELPNVVDTYKVPKEFFGHMDFQFSKNAPELVNQKLIDSIQKKSYY